MVSTAKAGTELPLEEVVVRVEPKREVVGRFSGRGGGGRDEPACSMIDGAGDIKLDFLEGDSAGD